MLMPSKVKYRKQQRGRMRGKAYRGAHARVRRHRPPGAGAGLDHRPPDRGRPHRDDPRASSAAARSGSASSRTSRSPRSRPKPAWARARAAPEGWVAVVKPGRILYEMEGVDHATRARGAASWRPTRSASRRASSRARPGDGDAMKKKERETLRPAGRRRARRRRRSS